MSDPPFGRGIEVDLNNGPAIAELDRILEIGKSRRAIRYRVSEVDVQNLRDFSHYLGAIQYAKLTPGRRGSGMPPASFEELLANVLVHLPHGMANGFRWLLNPTFHQMRLVMPASTMNLLRDHVTGFEFSPLNGGLWLASVMSRRSCRADVVVPAAGYERKGNYVVGPYIFGLRYLPEDFGPEDVQVIDEIRARDSTYRYNPPRLVMSRRFVELCLEHDVDGVTTQTAVFEEGFSPIPIDGLPVSSSAH